MQLHELQRQFASAVLHENIDAALTADVIGKGLEPARRLQVYRNNIRFTLREALQDIYPATYALVGDDFFKHLARLYLETHPPASGNILDMGAYLPEFISSFSQLSNLPYLEDVSKVDWFTHEAFHSESADPCDISRLGSFAPEQHAGLRLHLHPSVRLLRSRYPAFDIWRFAKQPDGEYPAPDLETAPQCVMVLRQQGETNVFRIEQTLYELARLLEKGTILGDAVTQLLEKDPNYDLQLGLQRLFSLRTIADISIDSPSM